MLTFLTCRYKLMSRFEAAEESSNDGDQIAVNDAITFIADLMGRTMPSVCSLTFSYLHLANRRNLADLFGFPLL